MSPYVGEFIGTMLLIILGNGVVANVLLTGTKGNHSGWIVVTMGWGMAVFIGVVCVADISGAHLNPAVTIGKACAGNFAWLKVFGYLGAQFCGAAVGAFLVWLTYRDHFEITDNADAKLGVFCTAPEIRNPFSNLFSEIIGTFVLVYCVLHFSSPEGGLGSLDALPVALTVLVIGLSLGGTTGYAINPARDLAPRIAHFLLPISGKRDSDWGYAWIPVVGPIVGGVIAAVVSMLVG